MTALSTLLPAFKRELAVPGDFVATFPDATDTELTGYLADAFGEAQLWGFFATLTLEPNGSDFETSAELSAAGAALVLLFAAARVIRNQLRNSTSQSVYKAGPVEYSTATGVNLMRDELAWIKDRLDRLIAQSTAQARAAAGTAFIFDMYAPRNGAALAIAGLGGFYRYEMTSRTLEDLYTLPAGR